MAGAVLGQVQVSLSWQARYLVKFKSKYHFSWQAQYLVKFGMILDIFPYEMLVASAKSNLGCAAGCGLTGRSRIMVAACCSDGEKVMKVCFRVSVPCRMS